MQHKQMHYSIIYAYNLLHSSHMFLPAYTIQYTLDKNGIHLDQGRIDVHIHQRYTQFLNNLKTYHIITVFSTLYLSTQI